MRKDIGKFYLSPRLVESPDLGHAFALLEFVPVRVEHLYYCDRFEMIGFSPLFRNVNPGEISPEYNVTLTTDTRGHICTVSVEKVKERYYEKG